MAKKTTQSRTRAPKVVALKSDAGSLLPSETDRGSLIAWLNLYMGVEVGDASPNTFKAKAADLTRFAEFFAKHSGGDLIDDWTPARTKAFRARLIKEKSEKTGQTLAPTTVNRVLASLRSAAKWVHRQRPFLAGFPMEKVANVQTDEPEWRGLSDLEVSRVRSASEQLLKINTKANQAPDRDHAILLVMLTTALRVSELANLDRSQYRDNYLWRVKRKGNQVTEKVFLPQDARDALDGYLGSEAGSEGPIFQSRTGRRMVSQNINDALKRIAAQANARIPEAEAIDLSPHDLRHTALRKMAQKKGIRFAQKMAGHASSQYIWRYVQPSMDDLEEAAEELYD